MVRNLFHNLKKKGRKRKEKSVVPIFLHMKSRIVVRKIAPGVSEEGFFGVLDDRLGTKDNSEREKWMTGRYFASGGGKKLSRAYIDFVDAEHAIAFEKIFRGFKFTDERGVSTDVSVEYAPIQQHYPFDLAASANEKEPTITEDADFMRFVQELTADPKTRADGGAVRMGTVEEEINEVPLLAMAYRNKMKKKLSIIRPSNISATSKIDEDKLIDMKKIEGVISVGEEEEKKKKKEKRRKKKKKETKKEKKARKEKKKEKKKAKRERRRQRREEKRKEKAAKKKASETKEEPKVKKIEIIKKTQQPQQQPQQPQQQPQQQQPQQQQPQQKSQKKTLVIKRNETKEPAKVVKLNVVRKNAAPSPSSSSSSSTTATTASSSSSSPAKPSAQESAPKEQPRKLVICRKQK